MSKKRIGLALTGSFCTFEKALEAAKALITDGWDVVPIFSENAYTTDTRFGRAKDWVDTFESLTGNKAISSLVQAEPIGPQKLLDLLLIAPCTGNTLAKLTYGITDTCVTMSAKSQLRNGRPVLIAVSTNDALGGSAKNIGMLLNYRNIYFVPLRQDDPDAKPRSMIADFSLIPKAAQAALEGKQLQPIYLPSST
ncbi:MAG TPA: dipicolinate synthase subunit B [Clostridiales bacterium]|nr:dipicolinate synthase subunit B [Clostridiales bacterium]